MFLYYLRRLAMLSAKRRRAGGADQEREARGKSEREGGQRRTRLTRKKRRVFLVFFSRSHSNTARALSLIPLRAFLRCIRLVSSNEKCREAGSRAAKRKEGRGGGYLTHGAVRRTDGAPPPSLSPPNRASPKIAPSHGSNSRLSFAIGPLPRLHTATVRSLEAFSIVFRGSRERGIRVEGARTGNASRVFFLEKRKELLLVQRRRAALERPLDFFLIFFQLFSSSLNHFLHFRLKKLVIRITRVLLLHHSNQGALFVVFLYPLAHSSRVALLPWSCLSSSAAQEGEEAEERERET